MDDSAKNGSMHAVRGTAALEEDWRQMMDWVKAGMPDLEVPEDDRTMLMEAFEDSGRQAQPDGSKVTRVRFLPSAAPPAAGDT